MKETTEEEKGTMWGDILFAFNSWSVGIGTGYELFLNRNVLRCTNYFVL